jgi:hypothetical protein
MWFKTFFSLPVFHGSFSIGGGVWRFVPAVAAMERWMLQVRLVFFIC